MKTHLLILLFFANGFFLWAQKPTKGDTKDAINARKVLFITKEMSLTSDEAQKLWPVYNEFEQKREDIRKERIKVEKKLKADKDKLSEKEFEELIDQEIEFRQKETDVQKERHKRLKKVLAMKKIALLYQAEEDFKMILLKEACANLKTPK
ncbi:MAG: hypothetical protein IAF38_17710 [Bacteroidia bacterium]|nr:hypothetical protein [Bacteroidia bacterium]